MMKVKSVCVALLLVSGVLQADDSSMDKSIDKAKVTAENFWEKTKEVSADLGEKASVLGEKASKSAGENGEVVWEKMKEAGSATKEGAKKGVDKVKEYINDSDCDKDSLFCFKD
ncbi:hypothetical protein [Marinomonas algarum]|uniref:Uncharacterized protein n=1 Tax=Marinomonas algarum TaxID=2883105 RepID=A0A9X1IK63_9GAMM|nr:hypothetical protein [Marinomonas algarum]MCB5160309.1 hypothetical protein [Marinomonas algarum]